MTTRKISDRLSTLRKALWDNVTILAVLIGLIVDLVALSEFLGLLMYPGGTPLPSRRGARFLVWVSVAMLYSLGFINSYVYKNGEDPGPTIVCTKKPFAEQQRLGVVHHEAIHLTSMQMSNGDERA